MTESSNDGTLGRIALKQVRVRRKESPIGKGAPGAERGARRSATPAADKAPDNPLNRLVPYLDLFSRLDDTELAKLSGVTVELAAQMRAQVDEVARALAHYIDLIDRLSEEELVRLTQAPPKTVRFWLLCQPRTRTNSVQASDSGVFEQPSEPANDSPGSEPRAGESERSDLSIELEEVEEAEDEMADFDPSIALVDDDDDDDDFF